MAKRVRITYPAYVNRSTSFVFSTSAYFTSLFRRVSSLYVSLSHWMYIHTIEHVYYTRSGGDRNNRPERGMYPFICALWKQNKGLFPRRRYCVIFGTTGLKGLFLDLSEVSTRREISKIGVRMSRDVAPLELVIVMSMYNVNSILCFISEYC